MISIPLKIPINSMETTTVEKERLYTHPWHCLNAKYIFQETQIIESKYDYFTKSLATQDTTGYVGTFDGLLMQ